MRGSCLLRMPHKPAHGAWGLQRAQTEKLQERSLVSAHPAAEPCARPRAHCGHSPISWVGRLRPHSTVRAVETGESPTHLLSERKAW